MSPCEPDPSDLGDREVRVWHLDPGTVSEHRWVTRARDGLDRDEWQARPDRASEATRVAFLAAHLLLRFALSQATGRAKTVWRFRREPGLRPEILEPALGRPIHFSLTHSDRRVACAVSRLPGVGVDAEPLDQPLETEDLAARHLSDEERGQLAMLSEAAARERFLELWTLREAFAKARGRGLSLDLTRLCFGATTDEGTASVRFDPKLGEVGEHWTFRLLRPEPRSCLAVAASATDGAVDVAIREIEPERLL